MTQQRCVFIVSLVLDVDVTTAVDIYSFGICALEARLCSANDKMPRVFEPGAVFSPALLRLFQMALLEIHGNGVSSYISQEALNSSIQLLENPSQKVR